MINVPLKGPSPSNKFTHLLRCLYFEEEEADNKFRCLFSVSISCHPVSLVGARKSVSCNGRDELLICGLHIPPLHHCTESKSDLLSFFLFIPFHYHRLVLLQSVRSMVVLNTRCTTGMVFRLALNVQLRLGTTTTTTTSMSSTSR